MSSTTVAPLDRDYLKKIGDGLDEAFAAAPVETLGAEERIVVFSDHHRGAGDGADDFRHCEHAYTAALGYYLAAGYRLFLLGDVEELWEEPPAKPLERYAKHDRAMSEWARERDSSVVVVAGHTHRPVFAGSLPPAPPTRPIAELEHLLDEAQTVAEASRLRSELEYARTARRRPVEGVSLADPCYFNTGCCSFPDGDITGIEIADGEIRLVRWPASFGETKEDGDVDPELRIRARRSLDGVFEALAAPEDDAPSAVEHRIAPPTDGGP